MPLPMSFRLSRRPKAPASPGAVRVWVGAGPRRFWRGLGWVLAIASVGGGVVLIGLTFRLGLRLMLDPEALPQGLALLPRSQPVTLPATPLTDLLEQMAQQQRLGEPLAVGDPDAEGNGLLLVPLLEADSEAIAGLTLIQTRAGGEEGWAIATLPIAPLPRDTVMAPWLRSPQLPAAVPRTFSPTQVVPLPPPPVGTGGIWLTLQGTWQQQGLMLRYGRLLYVDPQAQRLDLLEAWSSPVNRSPQWADLDGEGPSDLVVDETVDLEPALRGWQIIAGPGPSLQPISWVRVPIDAGPRAGTYQQALRLARGGLWGQAAGQLADLKTALVSAWDPAAEAQLRLIQRHAAITRQQANQDWSSPVQQLLALLIDGRWEAALARLEASPDLLPAVLNRLGVDGGRLWSRIRVAAALPDPPPALYVWGGLVLKAQPSQPTTADGATPDWLDRQPVPAVARQRLAQLLAAQARLQAENADAISPASEVQGLSTAADGPVPAIAPSALSAMIGQAQPIPAPNAGFAAPGQSLDASLGQWYAIELRAIYQGQSWQQGPPALPVDRSGAAAWSTLEPVVRNSPQLLRWASSTSGVPAPLTVRGLTLTNGAPTLLATGPVASAAPLPPLVFSPGALLWLDANQRQAPDPDAIAAPVAAVLWGSQTPPPDFAPALARLAQHSIDLTGDGQPERLITWDEAAVAQLRGWGVPVAGIAPKTIILSQDNAPLYSDIFASQIVIGLTNPALDGAIGLLVQRAGQYELAVWHEALQGFE